MEFRSHPPNKMTGGGKPHSTRDVIAWCKTLVTREGQKPHSLSVQSLSFELIIGECGFPPCRAPQGFDQHRRASPEGERVAPSPLSTRTMFRSKGEGLYTERFLWAATITMSSRRVQTGLQGAPPHVFPLTGISDGDGGTLRGPPASRRA
jgi:hypothetical protein